MTEKEVTISDIAKVLGISEATVSRALADHPRISKRTKKQVVDLAAKLGYRANRYARNLRDPKTYTIGVIVPRLNSQFMSSAIAGMEQAAQESGYTLLISQSSERLSNEQQIVKAMYQSRVDGLLVSVAYETNTTDHFDLLRHKKIPVVFFDRSVNEDHGFCVVIDNRRAGFKATEHLILAGCKRIVHITAKSNVNVYRDRLSGFRDALTEYGVQHNNTGIFFTDLSFESGEQVAEQILAMSPRPDGIFVANDNCAVGCINSLKESGLRVPEDVAVVGFNNDLVARVIEPKLTTIEYPAYEVGTTAVKQLIDNLNGSQMLQIAHRLVIKSELIARDSTPKTGLLQPNEHMALEKSEY